MSKAIGRWVSLPLFILAIAFVHFDIADLLIALVLAIAAQVLLMWGTDYL